MNGQGRHVEVSTSRIIASMPEPLLHPANEPTARRGYDWFACLASLVVAFAAAIPAGLLVSRLTNSGGLMVATITIVGTVASRAVYPRVARRGARPIQDETCPM